MLVGLLGICFDVCDLSRMAFVVVGGCITMRGYGMVLYFIFDKKMVTASEYSRRVLCRFDIVILIPLMKLNSTRRRVVDYDSFILD